MRGAKTTGPLSEADLSDAILVEQLGATDRSTQRLACTALAKRLAKHPELKEALRSTVREGTPVARFAAAFVLFGAERPTLRLLPALLDALELEDGDIRWQATHMLATLGRMQGEVFPVIMHEARNAPSPLRRRMALYTLRELAPEMEETAAACVDALDDPVAEVRRAALTCFGKLSGAGRDALDRVLRIATDNADPRMQGLAAVALPNLVSAHPEAGPAVREALSELSRSDQPSVVRAGAQARGRLEENG